MPETGENPMAAQIPVATHVSKDTSRRLKKFTGQFLIYAALIFWTFISLFPIYWTITTSFKVAVDVTQGHMIPWLQYQPDWKGWRALGLSPDTIFEESTSREEFL